MKELVHGWVPLLTAFLGVALGFGALSAHTSGAFFLPVSEQFGWTRAQFSLTHIGAALVGTIAAPFVGRFIDRFGPRKVAATSAVLCAGGFCLLSFTTGSLPLFITLAAVTALAGAGTSIITYVALVSMWFNRARGLAIGIIMSGSGVCAIIAPKLAIPFVAEAGWRAGYRGLAVALLLSVPLILIGGHRPRGNAADGKPVVRDMDGMTLHTAIRTGRFWRQAAAIALMGMGLSGLYAHFVPLLSDRGFDPVAAANVASLFGASVLTGRLLAGYLLDRIFAPYLATVFCLVAVIGLGALFLPGTMPPKIAGIAIGLAFGTELDIAGYITSRYFGRRAYGAIYGWQFSMFTGGGLLSPLIYGIAHDRTDSYEPALIVSIVAMLSAIPLMLSLGRYPTSWPESKAA